MAPVSWGSDPLNRQRMVTLAAGIVTVAVIGLVGRRLGGDRVGLAAAGLAAVYPNLWLSDGLVMSESISCLLVACALLLALRWLERPSSRLAAAYGAIAGLAALARSELLLLVPLAVVLMIVVGRRRSQTTTKHTIVLCAVAVGVLLPWVVFNAVRFDDPVLLTTNEGPLWLGANCPDSYYGPALGGWSLFCVIDAHVGERVADTSVRSTEQRKLGWSYARGHLNRVPVVVIARIGRTLDVYDPGGMVHGDVGEERERPLAWAGVMSFWLLAPFAVAGFCRMRRSHIAVLLMPVAVVAVTTVVFYGGHRIRSSLEPVIVLSAAVALTGLVRRPVVAL
jgi:hypothetical protein